MEEEFNLYNTAGPRLIENPNKPVEELKPANSFLGSDWIHNFIKKNKDSMVFHADDDIRNPLVYNSPAGKIQRAYNLQVNNGGVKVNNVIYSLLTNTQHGNTTSSTSKITSSGSVTPNHFPGRSSTFYIANEVDGDNVHSYDYFESWDPVFGKMTNVQKGDNVKTIDDLYGEYKQGGLIKNLIKLNTKFNKQGGTMNRTKYFQQGGAAPQQDMQQQIIQLVQAAMQGDQKATETINQIMQAAKQGDQQATQIAQMIQQVAQQMQGQATSAKWGAKLGYLRSLKYAKGGKTCPTCNQEIEMKKCGGKKAKKRYFGGWL